jgi:AraC family transcriptional regulator
MNDRTILRHHDGAAGLELKLVSFAWEEPIDSVYLSDRAMIDLALTPRPENARGRIEGRWRHDRFEPLGELLAVPAGVPMHGRAGAGRQNSLTVALPSDRIAPEGDWQLTQLRRGLDVRAHHIRMNCRRIAEELWSPGFASETIIEACAYIVAVDLQRHFATTAQREGEIAPRGGLAPWRKRLIDSRLRVSGAPPTLGELAELCNLSRRHLTRAFRQEVGTTLTQYILALRIDRAKSLLAQSDLALKQIAAELGFAGAASFSAAFKGAVGCAPRDYRNAAAAQRRGSRSVPGGTSAAHTAGSRFN